MTSWMDAANAAGSLATVLAFIGGLWIAGRYGRKANASISAEIHEVGRDSLITARPTIQAVGVFRLRFIDNVAGDHGAQVRVTEILKSPHGAPTNGRQWLQTALFETEFVEAGETLTTTVLFSVGRLPENLLGWRISFAVKVKRWPEVRGRVWVWADRTFVARPTVP